MPPLSHPSPTASGQTNFQRLPDFYGTQLNLLILGYIRPEYDYVSLEALVEDIRVDCEVARQSLMRQAYRCYFTRTADDDEDEEEEKEARGGLEDGVGADQRWLLSFH